MIGSSLGARVALATGPVVFAVLFVFRGVRPVADPTILGIATVLLVVTGFLLRGRRWAAVGELGFVVALFASPASRSFSFDLAGIDSTGWQVFAVVGLVSLGLAAATALVVLTDRRRPRELVLATVGGAALGVGFIVAIQAVEPIQAYATDLTDDQLAALPEVELLDFAYDPLVFEVPAGGVYRARLVNPTDVPHTFTVDELDLDVYVPARRWAVVEIDGAGLATDDRYLVICTIGDHLERGMQAVKRRG